MASGILPVERTPPGTTRADTAVTRNGLPLLRQERVRVEGKFFARGGQRMRIHGMTYGPFAADADGQPFPVPHLVREDFARMRTVGINAIRTYHVPPEWFLHLADESGMTVFVGIPWVDVPWRQHLSFLDSRAAQADSRAFVRRTNGTRIRVLGVE